MIIVVPREAYHQLDGVILDKAKLVIIIDDSERFYTIMKNRIVDHPKYGIQIGGIPIDRLPYELDRAMDFMIP